MVRIRDKFGPYAIGPAADFRRACRPQVAAGLVARRTERLNRHKADLLGHPAGVDDVFTAQAIPVRRPR
ncbi:hypothetical protein SUDANB105_00036 [Streptomyces sp. enrichment culture]|uniref:hypothetical protein n=1 Tax=Streptomyces sp. enrichment culture TaxID=1795815 RepID=UPI003F557435